MTITHKINDFFTELFPEAEGDRDKLKDSIKRFYTAEASYMAGHSSQKVTEKYTHLTAKRLKEKMDRLTSWLN